MKITIEASTKEVTELSKIAALTVGAQGQQPKRLTLKEFTDLVDDYEANYRNKPTQQI